jgi:MFS family permease
VGNRRPDLRHDRRPPGPYAHHGRHHLIYALFTGPQWIVADLWQFALFRFLTGLGVGGEFAAGAALVANRFPPIPAARP